MMWRASGRRTRSSLMPQRASWSWYSCGTRQCAVLGVARGRGRGAGTHLQVPSELDDLHVLASHLLDGRGLAVAGSVAPWRLGDLERLEEGPDDAHVVSERHCRSQGSIHPRSELRYAYQAP